MRVRRSQNHEIRSRPYRKPKPTRFSPRPTRAGDGEYPGENSFDLAFIGVESLETANARPIESISRPPAGAATRRSIPARTLRGTALGGDALGLSALVAVEGEAVDHEGEAEFGELLEPAETTLLIVWHKLSARR